MPHTSTYALLPLALSAINHLDVVTNIIFAACSPDSSDDILMHLLVHPLTQMPSLCLSTMFIHQSLSYCSFSTGMPHTPIPLEMAGIVGSQLPFHLQHFHCSHSFDLLCSLHPLFHLLDYTTLYMCSYSTNQGLLPLCPSCSYWKACNMTSWDTGNTLDVKIGVALFLTNVRWLCRA